MSSHLAKYSVISRLNVEIHNYMLCLDLIDVVWYSKYLLETSQSPKTFFHLVIRFYSAHPNISPLHDPALPIHRLHVPFVSLFYFPFPSPSDCSAATTVFYLGGFSSSSSPYFANLATAILSPAAWTQCRLPFKKIQFELIGELPVQAKDLAHHSYPIYHQRARRTSLHLDASSFERKPPNFIRTESCASSPSSSANLSPISPSLLRQDSAPLTPDGEFDATKEPKSGPQRSASGNRNKADREADKEKRKRSRVTPEQLVHLERFFSIDRSPTAVRRKEISELLGMQERQTQIWFQNRRAKAKLLDGRKGHEESAETPPDTPPELTPGYEVELHNLIHEDDPVNMILCTDLSIGTWRRIATTVGKHDLVAYVSDSKRCLTWFIHSAGYGFKMEIPFDTILDTHFSNASPGSGLASFVLSQPPVFYLENLCTPRPDGSGGRVWKRCADWTEGQQATTVLQHDLIGSAVQLAHLLRNLPTRTHGSDVQLHTPHYVGGISSGRSSPMSVAIPQPPMAGLSKPGYCPEETLEVPHPDYFTHGRKRSSSGPASLHHPHEGSDLPPIDISAAAAAPRGPSSATYPSSSYHPPMGRSHSDSYNSPMFSDYPAAQSHHVDYDSMQLGNSHVPRIYSRTFYDEEARIVAPYHLEALRRDSSASASITDLDTPSPPILTTPFHPPPEMLQHPKPSELITGMLYQSDEDIHHGHQMS